MASAVNATQMMDPSISDIPEIQTSPTSPSKIDPALLGDYVDRSSAHTASPGLDHLALLASKRPWGDGTVVDTAMTEPDSAHLAPANDFHGWGPDSSQHEELHAVSAYLQTPSSSKRDQPQNHNN